jgi:glycosyltransferase involved in cell wall biosynthesis
VEALRHACTFVEEVELAGPRATRLGRLARRVRLLSSLLRGKPMQVVDSSSNEYAARVRAVAAAFEPDIVHVEPRAMAQYLGQLAASPAPRVLVEHEPVSRTARAVFQRSRGLEKVVRGLDALAWRRFERRSTRLVDAIVVLTEDDRRAIEPSARGRPVVQIPLGVEIPAAPLDPLGALPPSVLFVGGFGHPPNVDAALRLAQSILPQVRQHRPDVVLYLVGDRPPKAVLELAGDDVVVTGRVADVRPFLDRAAVVVAPLRLGGGMRNKVLEALAAGKAVVASRVAAAGLDVSDGDQLRLAEQDDEIVTTILQLLDEPERRRELAARARAWAEANLDWERPVTSFDSLYFSLLGRVRE